jgi:hypothetical protein
MGHRDDASVVGCSNPATVLQFIPPVMEEAGDENETVPLEFLVRRQTEPIFNFSLCDKRCFP